jgi:hypothetical protein
MRGRPDRRFELIPGQRAETLDALTYALAAREGVALDAREEALKLYPASAQPAKVMRSRWLRGMRL